MTLNRIANAILKVANTSGEVMRQIEADLNKSLASLDAEILENTKKWVEQAANSIKDFKNNTSDIERREMGSTRYYNKLWDLAGSKKMYTDLDKIMYYPGKLNEYAAKICASNIKARNERIAKALVNLNINKVGDMKFAQAADGVQGRFVVDTDQGEKTITIRLIFAGGYNIQRLHYRTLVKVSG